MTSANSKTQNSKNGKNTGADNGKKPTARERSAARRARVEEQRRAERTRERRNRVLTVVLSTAILIGLAGGGWYLNDRADKKEAAEAAPLSGEKTWKKLTRNHVEKKVDYPMTPAAGGDHSPVWQNCNGDVYPAAIQNENAVHALEHGAVWITYNSEVAPSDVMALAAKVTKTPYTLMSPLKEQSSPITLTAWGHQVNVKDRSDPRVDKFLDKYVQGSQTPEPGAPCTGGLSA